MALQETLLRKTHLCWRASTRIKTSRVQRQTDQETNDDGRGLSGFLELTNIAMATSLPVGVLVVAGQTVKDIAGPSTILAVLLGAACAATVGLSFCEMSSKAWKAFQIGAYEYVYRSGSEAAAFLIAWLLLLHHCVISGLTSRAISENIDMLLANRVSNFSVREFGRVELFESRVDLIALLLSLLAMVLAAGSVSLPCRKRTSIIFMNCSLIAAVLFACVVALYHLEWKNWSTTSKFFPGGAKGVLSGAATTYFLFAMDGAVVRSRDSSSQSKRRGLIASLLSSNCIASLALIAVTSAMTLLLRHPTWFGDCSPLAEAYVSAGVVWMNYFLCPVSIVLLSPNLCTQMNRAVDVIHEVAEDGLLMRIFRKSMAPDNLSTPSVWSCIGAGTISSVGAMILNLTTLSQLASATVVCVHFVVIADVIAVRFRPKDENRKSTVRRSRMRERNGKNSGRNQNSDSCYGTTSSPNLRANGCDHPEVNNDLHPETIQPETTLDPTAEDQRREEDVWSPETDDVTDDVSSSDTDIDDVVDEYLQTTHRNGRTADDSLLDFRCTTTDSYRKSIRLLAVFITSGLVFAAIVCRLASSSVTNRAIIGVVTFVWFTVTLICAVRLLRLPRNEPGTRLLPFCDPIRLCVALAAILVVCCLANLFRGLTTVLLLIWIALGCVVYFGYGVRHSLAARDSIILPEEERGLIGRNQAENLTCSLQHQAPLVEITPS